MESINEIESYIQYIEWEVLNLTKFKKLQHFTLFHGLQKFTPGS